MALEDEEDHQQQPNGIESSQSVVPLPTEITVEILLRLPVDSLLRCKSVCKLCRCLISDPRFINSHLNLSTRNNHHRLIIGTRRNTFNTCHLDDPLCDNSVNPLKLDLPFKRLPKSVSIVGSCNGLLCLHVDDDILFLLNPNTRKLNRLPSNGHKTNVLSVHYGFGYEEAANDYKVVEISCKVNDRFCNVVKIYSVRNGNWKNIGDFPYGISYDYSGKYLNGAVHWGVLNYSAEFSPEWTIISLDLATETYGEVLQPVYDEGDKVFTLGALREWLCVLCDYHGIQADLWVMKVYGVKESWTKLVSIPYLTDPGSNRFSVPLYISSDGKLLLGFGWKLIVYDSKNGSFSRLENFHSCVQGSTFVESLVSPLPTTILGDSTN